MFEVGEEAELELYIWAHKETDGAYWYQEWVSLENYDAGWDESSTYFPFAGCMLFITVPVGVLLLMAAYSNPRLGMEFNHRQRTVVRQQFGRLPSLMKKTLHGVDVESLTLRPNRRFVHHSDEYGSSTTEHSGVDLIVDTGRGVHALAFVENDDTGERDELIAKLSSAIRGQVVDASFVESDAPFSVEPGADSSELAPPGAPNAPVDEQLVIEQVAPVGAFGAFSAVRDDVAADDVKHRPRDVDSESMGGSQAIQGGGFWNFEAEDAKE